MNISEIVGGASAAVGAALVIGALRTKANSARMPRTSMGGFFVTIGFMEGAYGMRLISKSVSSAIAVLALIILAWLLLASRSAILQDETEQARWADAREALRRRTDRSS